MGLAPKLGEGSYLAPRPAAVLADTCNWRGSLHRETPQNSPRVANLRSLRHDPNGALSDIGDFELNGLSGPDPRMAGCGATLPYRMGREGRKRIGYVTFAKLPASARLLREGDGKNRRLPDIAGQRDRRRSWAESDCWPNGGSRRVSGRTRPPGKARSPHFADIPACVLSSASARFDTRAAAGPQRQ